MGEVLVPFMNVFLSDQTIINAVFRDLRKSESGSASINDGALWKRVRKLVNWTRDTGLLPP